MDNPVTEIPGIIQTLCTAPPAIQRNAIETYFTPNASFTHPFCRTGSFAGSVWLIIMIYRWYKILSPHIDMGVDSVAFDKEKMLLYVSVHQNFKLWMVPLYNAPVKLVTVLHLTKDPIPEPPPDESEIALQDPPIEEDEDRENGQNEKRKVKFAESKKSKTKGKGKSTHAAKEAGEKGEADKYYIQSQNDLYQTSEFIKFVVPWGLGVFLVVLWQFCATIFCVWGALVFDFACWLPRRLYGYHFEVFDNHSREQLGDD